MKDICKAYKKGNIHCAGTGLDWIEFF